jgi:UPF0176 protein
MTFKIAAFYRFTKLAELRPLVETRVLLKELMMSHSMVGTMIIANEGFNATVCGAVEACDVFIRDASVLLGSDITPRITLHGEQPFRKAEVKIKREIVTLGRPVEMALGDGTHVTPSEWNALVTDPATIVIDARNWYEVKVGRFPNAVDPGTEKFSDLPAFIEENYSEAKDRTVAMYCTGGIRCEKLAPLLRARGFDRIAQLQGGILGYLESVPESESLWDGECFVFDSRTSVDRELRKGRAEDPSTGERV